MTSPRRLHSTPQRWAWFVLWLVAIGGALLVVFRDSVLPANFFSDGRAIQAVAQGLIEMDSSYQATAFVYRLAGLADHELLASLIGYAVAVSLVILALRRSLVGGSTEIVLTIVGSIVIIACAIYLGYYSKDVIVALMITGPMLIARPNWRGELFIIAAIATYAAVFRSYYFLILGLYIGIRLMMRHRPLTPRRWVLLSLAAGIATSIALLIVLGTNADAARQGVNASREVNTQIDAFVSLPEPFGGIINNLLTQMALIVPVPLALTGPFYFLIGAAVIVLWILFLIVLRRVATYDILSTRSLRIACLLAAFLAVQAAFEPDYGSAIRHLSPLMPLILAVIGEGWSPLSARNYVNADSVKSSSTGRLVEHRF